MTINKSQGHTFDKIGVDLRRDVFNHGQFYVAMSWIRFWDSIKIYLGSQRQSNVVKNFVYTEVYKQIAERHINSIKGWKQISFLKQSLHKKVELKNPF